MELVEGETLAERIARGAIPMEELLPLFEQIAKGVEAANEKGILHRDLKPANIKITLDDDIKILDFGLAKAFHEEPPISDSSQSPTLSRGTQLGTIMGTYMSPEQARGKALDHRILPVLEDLRGIPGGLPSSVSPEAGRLPTRSAGDWRMGRPQWLSSIEEAWRTH